MKQTDAPCMKCQTRNVGCHKLCEKYIVWKKKQSEEKEKQSKEKLLNDYEKDRAKKIKQWKEEHRP